MLKFCFTSSQPCVLICNCVSALCFFVCVCECVCVCVWSHQLHTFVKGPIMMMICSLQWFYSDDLISSLRKSSPPPVHSFHVLSFCFCFFCCRDAAAIRALTKHCCRKFQQRRRVTRVTPPPPPPNHHHHHHRTTDTQTHTCTQTHTSCMLCGRPVLRDDTPRTHTHTVTLRWQSWH